MYRNRNFDCVCDSGMVKSLPIKKELNLHHGDASSC